MGVEIDEGVVMQLVAMEFDMEGCKRAVYHTHNQGVEPAMNWVLEHMGDAGVYVCVCACACACVIVKKHAFRLLLK